jgi:OOP family OmpA-OmpF porin
MGQAAVVVVSFDRGSWRVGNRASYALERTADELRHAAGQIEVAGHADARGPDDLNQTLSERRARAVAVRLEQAGIVASRIAVTAFGSRRPSDTGNDRRVEVYVRGSP